MSAKSVARVAQKVSAETGVSIVTTQAGTAVSAATAASGKAAAATGAKVVTTGIWTKVVAGVAAASIAISAPFVASQIKDDHDDSSLQNTIISDTQYTSHETLQSTPEIIPEETIVTTRNLSLEYYAPVFEQYQMAMSHDFYFDPNGMPVQSNNPQEYLSFLLSAHSRSYRNYCKRHYHESLYDEDYHVYYCLLDLNDDGIEELFVGAGANSETAAIYSLFSYDGTKPIRLSDEGALGERAQMTVFDDNSLCIRGSGGYAYNYQRFYIMPQDSLQLKIYKECNMEDSDIYILDETGTKTTISTEQFSAVWNNEGMYPKQLDWQEIIPKEVIHNAKSEDTRLQDYLDISKSWGIRKDVSSSPDYPMEQVFDFAFMEDGSFFCYFYQQYTDFQLGFHGVYTYEDNQVNFYFNSDDGISTLYSYSFDCTEMKLIQISENGLWNSLAGTEYSLVNDEWNPFAQDVISRTENAIAFAGQEMGG